MSALVVLLYPLLALVALIVMLQRSDVHDLTDFLLVLPVCVMAAAVWPVSILFYGLYLVVRS